MFKKFIINCDEATTICDKSQYKEASFSELVKLNWHILTCKICNLYSKQNRKMTSLFKMKSLDCKNQTNCMSKEDKEILKKQIEELKL